MKTKAALLREVGAPIEVREVELEEPRAGEVLVRMSAVGVCGSDLHFIRGNLQAPTPVVLGHEGAGRIEAVGSGVDGLAEGDPVVLQWAPGCGECASCRRGRPGVCMPMRRAYGAGTMLDGTTRLSLDGETVYRLLTVGAWSEHVVLPARAALQLPDGVELEQAAVLGCAAITGFGAVANAAAVEPGATAIVIGAGGVGQFVVEGLRLAGAETIVVVDPVSARREQALRLGATAAVDPDELKGFMKDSLPDGADYGFEVVGSPETQALALRWTRDAGTTVLVGIPKTGARLELDSGDLISRDKRLVGSIVGSADPAVSLPAVVEHVRAGRIDVAGLLGPSYALDDVNDAVAAALDGSPGRVLVTL